MGTSLDYPNVQQWQPGTPYSPPARVRHNGNVFDLVFGQNETYEPGVGDPDSNGWRFYDELYDQTPHTRTWQAKIIAYIPTWRRIEGFRYDDDLMYRYLTDGIIAFLMFSESNLGEFEPRSLDDVNAVLPHVLAAGRRNGVRISIALGGATDFGFLALMTSIGNDPEDPRLAQAVQNVTNFVNSNNLDGVDLDLECWWGRPGANDQGGRRKSDGPHPAGYALTLFAQRLKQAMPGKLVSAAVFGTSWYGNNYDPRLADHVDWLGIMTYDLTGSWDNSPIGPHTALFKVRNLEAYAEEQQGEWPGGGMESNPILSVEDSLWYWTNPSFVNWQGPGQNIPRNKIAAGVPVYGYDFAYAKDPDDLSGEVPPGYRAIRYGDILRQFPDAHTATGANIKVGGSTPRPPFISASGNYPHTNNIYFETPRTAIIKLLFLMNVGAQGVIIWELSNDVWDDTRSIIRELYKNSGNVERPEVAGGSTVPAPVQTSWPVTIPATGQSISVDTTMTTGLVGGAQERVGQISIRGIEGPGLRYEIPSGQSRHAYLTNINRGQNVPNGLPDLMMFTMANQLAQNDIEVVRLSFPGISLRPEDEAVTRYFVTRYRFRWQEDPSQVREIRNRIQSSGGRYPPPEEWLIGNWNTLSGLGEWEAPVRDIVRISSGRIAATFRLEPLPPRLEATRDRTRW